MGDKLREIFRDATHDDHVILDQHSSLVIDFDSSCALSLLRRFGDLAG